jgi:hypothetical protein
MARLLIFCWLILLILLGAQLHSPRPRPIALGLRQRPIVWRAGVAGQRWAVEIRVVRII